MSEGPSISFPLAFVKRWNQCASDGVVTSSEVAELEQTAKSTPAPEDDAWMARLRSLPDRVTKPYAMLAELQNFAKQAAEAGLKANGVVIHVENENGWRQEVFLQSGGQISGGGIRTERDDSQRFRMFEIDAGYQYSKWEDADGTSAVAHGIHAALSFVPWRSEYFYPAVEAAANIGCNRGAFTGGGGAGAHVGYGDLVDAYGKITASGHALSIGGDSKSGWSVDATAGARILFLYGEAVLPIASGGRIHQPLGISAGLHGHF